MKKIIIGLFTLVLAFIGVSASVYAESELEQLIIEGKVVHYLNKSTTVYVPTEYKEDVHEMRGVWVATVWNNDVNQQKGTSEKAINEWKEQYLQVLEVAERYNMNTIFFQVRPTNDAFYPSIYNDWSKFMAGTGVNPGWNPLEWMVEETHKRGMYFQCWLNAYRVSEGTILGDTSKLASDFSTETLLAEKKKTIAALGDNNFAKKHPEYVLLGEYDTKLILNPGEPAVREHILNTIKELVTDYDIDGFHFDDYFYLNSKSSGTYNSQTHNLNFAGGVTYNEELTGENTLNDLGTYNRYLENPEEFQMEAGLNLGDFRRQSINLMMKEIREFVDEYNEANNKYVEFGSKPAAVWQSSSEYCRNQEQTHPDGSNTTCGAYSSNYNLFADTKYWVEAGYVDWVAPQVYYDFANREVPYADIVEWWVDVVEKTNAKRAENNQKPVKLYIAHGIYNADEHATRFKDPNEMVYQLKFNQKFDIISGSAVYAYNDLTNFTTTLQQTIIGVNFYNLWNKNKAIPLTRGEYDAAGLSVNDFIFVASSDGKTIRVKFDKNENASMYVIYRVPKGTALDTNNTDHRFSITKSSSVEGEQMIIKIGAYNSDTYDYYLQPISNNFHLSDQITKIEASDVQINTAPEVENFVVNNGQESIIAGLPVNIQFDEAIDNQKDDVTYQIDISVDGIDGPFRFNVSEFEVKDGKVNAVWKSLNYPNKEAVVRLIVSDGELKNTYYSQGIILLSQKDPVKLSTPSINNVDLDNYQIQYSEVSNADKYQLYIYDQDELLATVMVENDGVIDYDFIADKEYILKLQAESNSENYLSSELSNEYIFVPAGQTVTPPPSTGGAGCSMGIYIPYLLLSLAGCIFLIKFKK